MSTTQELLDALLAKKGQDYYAEFSAFMSALLSDNTTLLAQALGSTTSASSLSVGTGSKTFVLASDRPYGTGAFVVASRASAPATWMFGQVTDKTGTSLTVNVTATNGSGGPYTDWSLVVAGPQGATGTVTPATETVSGGVTLADVRRIALRHAFAR